MVCYSVLDPLPDELLLRIFDFLELSELVLLMPVARHWNSLIVGHRTYWDNILLGDPDKSPACVAFFHLRLARSASKPTKVSVWYESAAMADILRNIAMHLTHITSLRITTSLGHSGNVFAALAQSAPILKFLSLSFHEDSPPCLPPTAPLGLLNCDSPALRNVRLYNLFVSTPIPPALRGVEKLVVGGNITLIDDVSFAIPNVFALFPSLVDLELCEDVTLDAAFRNESSWTNIRRLTFSAGHPAMGRVWHRLDLPVRRVPFIAVSGGDLTVLATLANDLDGALTLKFRFVVWNAARFVVTITSDRSSLQREVAGAFPKQTPQMISQNVWTRVASIMLPDFHWDTYAPFFGSLPSLEDVVLIVFTPWTPTAALSAQLICPRLKRLSIYSRNPSDPSEVVDIEALAAVVIAILRDAPLPLDLHLINSVPSCATTAAMRTFKSITIRQEIWADPV